MGFDCLKSSAIKKVIDIIDKYVKAYLPAIAFFFSSTSPAYTSFPFNIYFKPRAISTHSLYMLFVAFFHTQEILGKAVVEASAQAAALIFRAWLYFLLFLSLSLSLFYHHMLLLLHCCCREVCKGYNLTSMVCGFLSYCGCKLQLLLLLAGG